ncbi:MAG: sugar transferase [Lachnospiraceae bacterium]|nr:sugar transferase [Lachnospiraceae bacterium]
MYEKRKRIEQLLSLMLELTVVFVSLFIAYYLRYRQIFGIYNAFDQDWVLYIFLASYLTVGLAHDWYRNMFRRGWFAEFRSIFVQGAVCMGIIIAFIYMLHRASEISRLVYGIFFAVNTLLIWAERLLFKAYMFKVYKSGRNCSKLLLIVPSDNAFNVIEHIINYREWNRKIIGIALTDDITGNKEVNCEETIHGYPVVCGGKNLIEYATHNEIDEVFIYDNALDSTDTLTNWVAELQYMGIVVNVCISSFDIIDSGKKTLNRVGKYATVEYARNIFSVRQMALKKALDITGSLVGLFITGLIFPFVALAIKLDSKGPVIFKQNRVGRNGRIFKMYKFRSMLNDAEEQQDLVKDSNQMDGLMFKSDSDPRVTRVGKFLRKTSLDEFPQFFNVLKGDMSLVGTRPPTVQEYEQYSPKHKCRLCMTPGITGMWQVSGRSEITDFEEVIRLDMDYIDGWTIWKDIKILFLTVFTVIMRKGAK